jgi:hypothetical protein
MDYQLNHQVFAFQLSEKMDLERLTVRELYVKNFKKIKNFAKCKLIFQVNLITVVNRIQKAKSLLMVMSMVLVSFKKMEAQLGYQYLVVVSMLNLA